jgi:hypothetical protein
MAFQTAFRSLASKALRIAWSGAVLQPAIISTKASRAEWMERMVYVESAGKPPARTPSTRELSGEVGSTRATSKTFTHFFIIDLQAPGSAQVLGSLQISRP